MVGKFLPGNYSSLPRVVIRISQNVSVSLKTIKASFLHLKKKKIKLLIHFLLFSIQLGFNVHIQSKLL